MWADGRWLMALVTEVTPGGKRRVGFRRQVTHSSCAPLLRPRPVGVYARPSRPPAPRPAPRWLHPDRAAAGGGGHRDPRLDRHQPGREDPPPERGGDPQERP